MFEIVLVHPEIPPNTGNVIRLCANTGCRLHLVAPLGFELDDARLRRAGLDYHEYATVTVHADWEALLDNARPRRLVAFTTRGEATLATCRIDPGDFLVFGSETAGLPAPVLGQFDPTARVRLPMRPRSRSLNLSNAVAVVVFEAWRRHGYAGGL
jgi:tRNA (cytidine/uridine-2'-O-)-methyltransferase